MAVKQRKSTTEEKAGAALSGLALVALIGSIGLVIYISAKHKGISNFFAGLGGSCVCSNCGTQVPHTTGLPCNTINCPSCGTIMERLI